MNALTFELNALNIPSSYYSIGQHQNERTCLLESDDEWLVYFAERGRREDLHKFSNFIDAREFFLSVLKT